ncbi:hypothetical protein [Microbacterium sp. EST19A]|nr:hypothetical protein [Microbacterium sp. EST19A]
MSYVLPDGYAATLDDLKKHVHAARLEETLRALPDEEIKHSGVPG